MMAAHVPLRLTPILREVIAAQCPELDGALAPDGTLSIGYDESSDLQQALANELCDTGLDEHDEPNERGYAIERLIDIVGQAGRERP
jgi:hypothetical protein